MAKESNNIKNKEKENNVSDKSSKHWISEKYRNFGVRFIVGAVLLLLPFYMFYYGITAIILVVLIGLVKGYHEIISVAYRKNKDKNLPFFRLFQWYSLFVATFIVSGKTLYRVCATFLKPPAYTLNIFDKYHLFISYSLLIIGIVSFVLNLKASYYKIQFQLFSWYQLTLLILTIPFHIILRSIFTGTAWFFLPIMLIVVNDIFAYFFGISIGKTPLIKISPKKTWEGFIGGGFATILCSFLLSYLMTTSEVFYCPVQFSEESMKFITSCDSVPFSFQLTEMQLPLFLTKILQMIFFQQIKSINIFPIYLHGFAFSLFASIIAPFGGFFASGFKRAFKVKDFGDTFPGHGGIMDRLDCQILMAVFVNVYIFTFVNDYSVDKVFKTILKLSHEQKLEIYTMLRQNLLVNP